MKRAAMIAWSFAAIALLGAGAYGAIQLTKPKASPYAASTDLDVSDDFSNPMPPIVSGYRVKMPDRTARWIDIRFAGDEALQASKDGWTAVHVWATWCSPCVRELPELNTALPEIEAAGLRFFTVNVDHSGADTPESIAAMFASKGYDKLAPLVVPKADVYRFRDNIGFGSGASPYPLTMIYGPGGVPVAYVTGAGGEAPKPFWRSPEFIAWLGKVKAGYRG